MKLYAIEAEWDTGWRYDDWASTDLKDAKAALKRRSIHDEPTNYRIAVYERVEGC